MPARHHGQTVFVRDTAIVTRRLADETVILPLRNNVADLTAIYTLNDTGTFIWELLDGRCVLEEICRRVVEVFDADPAEVQQDVQDLLADLEAEGLVRQRAD